MTPFRLACSALVLSLAQTAFAADALPHRKSGLWEIQMTIEGQAAPMGAMQTCVDQASDDLMQANAQQAAAKHCGPTNITRDGNQVKVHSECSIDKMKSVSDAVFTGDFDSTYRGTISTRYTPPIAGRSQSQMTMAARWLGPCKAGQKGGDMIINGMTFNPSAGKAK